MAGTVLRMGWTDPLSDAFGAHPLLGEIFDLNDGVTFTLLDETLALEPPVREVALAGNPRITGERATRALYRRNRQARAQLSLGPMASASDLIANVRALVRWLDAPPAVPVAVQWQPPSASAPVYLDVVGAAHGIPTDEREWLRLQAEPIEVIFLVRPGLRGDRITLSNLVVNPGFEGPSGPAVTVFSDTFATLDAYSAQAGAALTQDSATYADAVMADGPARYYRLDETSGATIYDAGSSGVNGGASGAPTQGVAGLLAGDADTCYTFAAAASQYASAASAGLPTSANAPLSLECWFSFAANPGATQFLVCVGDRGTSGKFLALTLLATGAAQVSNGAVIVNTGALTTGVAHHLVGMFDGANVHLYVDGAQVGTGTAAALTLAYVGSQPFAIAASSSGTGPISPANFFSGQVDEVACYTSALSGTRIAAHYTAGTTPPASAANTARLASGARVAFGSPAWGPLNLWQTRFRYTAGATATWYLHYTDANNTLACVVSGATLTLTQTIGGVAHTLGSTAAHLVSGMWYWLAMTQFPCAPGAPAAVQAQVSLDGVDAAQGSPGAALSALLGPVATYDTTTALSGAPQIAVSGGTLGLGGAYPNVHTVSLFGPGGWIFTGADGSAAGVASGAWEQSTANTWAGGAVISYAAARIDLPPAGTVSAWWETYSGGAPAGTSAIPATTGQVVAASIYARSTALSATAQISLRLREWDASGTLLRASTLLTLTGNQAGWVALSGAATLGAATAYVSLQAAVSDATAGASAQGALWLDSAQAWNVTTSGVAAGQMPYCELRFAQSPAQLLVTGLLGDLPAPAHVAWGTYLASWAIGATLTWALGRRARASAQARLVGETLGYYGAALTPTTTPTRSAGAWSGFYAAALVNPGWNPRAFSFAAADAPGVYHLLHRFWSAQTAGNLANLTVRVVAEQKNGAWYGALTGSDLLGAYNGPYVAAPLSASSTWTLVDAGQVNVPAFPSGALTDLTRNYLTPRPQWTDATAGGAMARCDWQALLPVDGSLLVGVVNNPGNAPYAVTAEWLWAYVDGLLTNRAGVGDAASLTYSIEAAPLANPAVGAGGPGTATTGAINLNSGADPYLTLDPTVGCAADVGGLAVGGAGANQLVGYVADNSGAVLPLHVELQYSPLYLYPR